MMPKSNAIHMMGVSCWFSQNLSYCLKKTCRCRISPKGTSIYVEYLANMLSITGLGGIAARISSLEVAVVSAKKRSGPEHYSRKSGLDGPGRSA